MVKKPAKAPDASSMMVALTAATQNDSLEILKVLKEAGKPMTVTQIRNALKAKGILIPTDLIETHLVFLTDPNVGLVKTHPGPGPTKYFAV